MALPLEDYALIGDTHTAALVGRDGSIDWLCLPRFDSGACFAALLGEPANGRWLVAPAVEVHGTTRRYRGNTLVLETEFSTAEGTVRVIDSMPPRREHADVVRVVEGLIGRVPMQMELVVRFDYGRVVPWVRKVDGCLAAVAGPDALCLRTAVELRGEAMTTVAKFSVAPGERVSFVLSWHPSNEPPPPALDADQAIAASAEWWESWAAGCPCTGEWAEPMQRSLIVLKALTYGPTGAIVAAPTTSLPEELGGQRNWDYRFSWLRDAAFTLEALVTGGYLQEARAWRDWLLRAAAGDPAQLQIVYGVAGERRLTELELAWLAGYGGSRPVRIGNAASEQFQLDVYGEVLTAMHQAREAGLAPDDTAWAFQRALVEFVEKHWRLPDEGIWEVRGPRRHFTHSKVMAWAALDRAVRAIEQAGCEGPLERWRAVRAEIRSEVLARGYDPVRRTFTQSYGSDALDASLLLIPLVGFLPPDDPRVRGTVEAIERELVRDGLVFRYAADAAGSVDGLPRGEGAFLACSFWLVDNLALLGRLEEARALFERLLGLANDLGLLAEEYDLATGRLVGNFPQAFSHVGLINSARRLTEAGERALEPRA